MSDFASRPWEPVRRHAAPNGMVCAIDHLASGAGVAMLRAGGTAADAAVAASAVLAVTSPHMCGMGGDLLAVVAAPGQAPVALDSAGFAGSGADAAALRAEGHATMPFTGDVRTVTVPGCVDGWVALHGRFGALPLGEVLGPARDYAAGGFPVSSGLADALPDVAHLASVSPLAALGPVPAGTVVRQPGLARALDAVIDGGRDGFYGGELGAGLLTLGAGQFTPSDLARPIARWRPALRARAWGRDLWTVPPPSQGYLALAGAVIAAGLDLPADPSDPRWAHLLIESTRQAAWDRLDVLADGVDGDPLVAEARLAPRRAAIAETAATLGDAYGPGGTIATVAVDRARRGVTLLQSNASGFGAHLVVPGLGIFLHNRGIGFNLVPGHPNELAPGRRPAHTLSPVAVTAPDGALDTVMGTMGADSQPQILLQLLARHLHGDQHPAVAVAAGRWTLASSQSDGGFDTWRARGDVRVQVEGHAPAAWAPALAELGHRVVSADAFSSVFGHAHLIAVAGNHLVAGSDPRSEAGAAAGW